MPLLGGQEVSVNAECASHPALQTCNHNFCWHKRTWTFAVLPFQHTVFVAPRQELS